MTILNPSWDQLAILKFVMSSNEPSTSDSVPTIDLCAVCGAQASGKRYGSLSCLGCIVFFRRTVLKNMKYRCQRDGKCEITPETRCVCRYCRMQKCLDVGMNPDSIQIRDVIGPRKPRDSRSTVSPNTPLLPSPSMSFPPSVPNDSDFDINNFVDLQKSQWEHHRNYSEEEEKFTDGCVFMKNDYHHRGTSCDINLSLKLAIENCNDYLSLLKFYQDLSEAQRIKISSEYSIGFMLIDQAYKTVHNADDGFWLLQNGSFLGLHPDFKFEDRPNEEMEKCHFDFVTQLLSTIGEPFKLLKIDELECAILKILILLNPESDDVKNQCMKILMENCSPERFGEIILLISSIRCAIKAFYNMTTVSDLFDVEKFDDEVRNALVK